MNKSVVNRQPWFIVDKEGLRKTLARKGKAFAIFELVQNAYDEDATEVVVTLTQPKQGKAALVCRDNAPKGYADLATAHTMFAESKKKADPTKRGRFNVGDKYVLALCDEATITSTTGRVLFNRNGTRSSDLKKKTKAGSEFRGELPLSHEEFEEISRQVKLLLPPIRTVFNGEEIPYRPILHEFPITLPTEVADENGVCRSRQRATSIRLYALCEGETPMLYEKGIPVVEIDGKWHVDVQQKIPLNIERDNVTPSYLKNVYAAILNERKDYLTEEDAAAPWVRVGMADPKVNDDAVKVVLQKRFGSKAVIYDRRDKGSNKECASQDYTVVPIASMSKEEWRNVKRAGAMPSAGEVCPTNHKDRVPAKILSRDELTTNQAVYERLIEALAPLMIGHKVTVLFVDDKDLPRQGCTRWKAGEFLMEVNLAFHNPDDWHDNYELLIHEFAHHAVQSNDHLVNVFYETVTEMGAKLAQLALTHRWMFPNADAMPAPEEHMALQES